MKPIKIRITCYVRALALGLILASPVTLQAANQQAQSALAYVDSVNNWGSWELGLEPAAGGPLALPDSAISNRPANVRFRPNDNSVYGVTSPGVVTLSPGPTPAPLPSAPPTAGPGTAPPGGPGDRF